MRGSVALVLFLLLSGCVQSGTASLTPAADRASGVARTDASLQSPIRHVVVIVQENRSVDNLFNGLAGADTVQSGQNSQGQKVPLQPVHLAGEYDMSHTHSAYETEYAGGKMNGFDVVQSKCGRKAHYCPPSNIRAYAYVSQNEVQTYFSLAERFTFADEMFETNQGPSFPAHQYLVSGTSTISDGSPLRASENPRTREGKETGGCDAPRGTRAELINTAGREISRTFPCFDRTALPDLIDKAGYSWHYYQENAGPGLWNGLDAIQHIWQNRSEYDANVIVPSSQFLQDVAGGYLANVTWITPSAKASDHPLLTDGTGPAWVGSLVNAIGQSQFWDSTAVIVVWDDWGGWYDHAVPHQYNSYELGMRVPMIVVSAYSKPGYVSHVHYEFGSILKFIEHTFHLGSMNTTDVRAANLTDCFDFGALPHAFQPVKTKYSAQYFLNQPASNERPDND